MKKLLLAGAAALALSTAAQAETTWDAGPMGPVTQVVADAPNALSYCAVRLHDAPDALASVDIVKYHDGSVRFLFVTRSISSWNSGGRVTFDIDGEPWTLNMHPSKNATALVLDADSETGPALDLLHALYNGQTLTVTAGPQRAIISLTGSATAITVLNSCRDAVVAQRSGTTTTATAVPTQPLAVLPQTALGEAALMDNGQGTFNVHASLNGSIPMDFTLDSGAAGLSIPRWVADQLMGEGRLAPADFRRVITSVLADNREVPEQLYMLKSVTIAGRTVYDVPCVVGDDNSMMLLGQSVLKKFKSWSIDNERHVLVLS
jgi:predicted aspartyl protease